MHHNFEQTRRALVLLPFENWIGLKQRRCRNMFLSFVRYTSVNSFYLRDGIYPRAPHTPFISLRTRLLQASIVPVHLFQVSNVNSQQREDTWDRWRSYTTWEITWATQQRSNKRKGDYLEFEKILSYSFGGPNIPTCLRIFRRRNFKFSRASNAEECWLKRASWTLFQRSGVAQRDFIFSLRLFHIFSQGLGYKMFT